MMDHWHWGESTVCSEGVVWSSWNIHIIFNMIFHVFSTVCVHEGVSPSISDAPETANKKLARSRCS